jgi:hypothetical protein
VKGDKIANTMFNKGSLTYVKFATVILASTFFALITTAEVVDPCDIIGFKKVVLGETEAGKRVVIDMSVTGYSRCVMAVVKELESCQSSKVRANKSV